MGGQTGTRAQTVLAREMAQISSGPCLRVRDTYWATLGGGFGYFACGQGEGAGSGLLLLVMQGPWRRDEQP